MNPPVFLSASFPSPERDPVYWQSRQLPRLNHALRELAMFVLPRYPLVFGGHPAITPLIYNAAQRLARDGDLDVSPEERILLYQSRHFQKHFPPQVESFPHVALTDARHADGRLAEPNEGDRAMSLMFMRYQMLADPEAGIALPPEAADFFESFDGRRGEHFGSHRFTAAIFVGGMEGVEKEYNVFRTFHPETAVFPVASTGSAAGRLLESRGRGWPAALREVLEDPDPSESWLRPTISYRVVFEELFDRFGAWTPPPPSPSELEDHLESRRG